MAFMNPIKTLAVLVLFLPATALAGEMFECRDIYDARSNLKAPVLVVAIVNDDGKTGEIRVAGVTHAAKYSVDGLNRVWLFDKKYKLVVEPNGESLSFGEGGSNIQSYLCTKV